MFTRHGLRLIAWLLLTVFPTGIAAAQDSERALAVEREVRSIAPDRVLWPRFDPLSIPLAVFTGERTYLFRHPSPPEDFAPLPDTPAIFVFQGRHPAVTSNTNAEIGGVPTATLLIDRAEPTLVSVETADGRPLWPQGFDPLNVERVDGGLLHTRFLKLGNDDGALQVIDEGNADVEAFTEGVGPHPLFNGVRRLTVAGLAKPEVATEGGQVTIQGSGFMATFKNAIAQVNGSEIVVRLARPEAP